MKSFITVTASLIATLCGTIALSRLSEKVSLVNALSLQRGLRVSHQRQCSPGSRRVMRSFPHYARSTSLAGRALGMERSGMGTMGGVLRPEQGRAAVGHGEN